MRRRVHSLDGPQAGQRVEAPVRSCALALEMSSMGVCGCGLRDEPSWTGRRSKTVIAHQFGFTTKLRLSLLVRTRGEIDALLAAHPALIKDAGADDQPQTSGSRLSPLEVPGLAWR